MIPHIPGFDNCFPVGKAPGGPLARKETMLYNIFSGNFERGSIMAFNTPAFLFMFLPLSLILYRLVPGQRGKNLLLLPNDNIPRPYEDPHDQILI